MGVGTHLGSGITVLVPARDDAVTIGDAVRSLRAQTRAPARIIVIDDHSRDDTALTARGAGATVVSPPARTGSRAACRNFALPMVATELVLTVDPDVVLAPDAIEKLLPGFADAHVAAVSGVVLPRYLRSVWERGRWVEHLLASAGARRFPGLSRRPLPAPGCFTMYRTARLRAVRGWRSVTHAEDLDLAWRLCRAGFVVRSMQDSIGHRVAPAGLAAMSDRSRRWARGLVRNVRLHRAAVWRVPALRTAVLTAAAEATAAALLLLVAPLLAMALFGPWPLVASGIPAAALLVPLAGGLPRRLLGRAITGVPAFLVLRALEACHLLWAAAAELLVRPPEWREAARRAPRRAPAHPGRRTPYTRARCPTT